MFGSESGRIQDIKDLSDKESELADKLKALYHERDVLTGTDTSKELDVALASGAADQSAAESEQEAAASWARKLAQLRIALIDDEHERRMATIKEEYDAEIASARESAASQATLNAIEQGRALAIEAAQRDVAKRQAEQAKQEAEDRAAFLDSAAIADADRLYEIKRLELEATKDGYDLQVSLLALEEERATLMAKAAGENLAYVEREFAIRRQLLNQTDTNVGGGAQARGLFNVAARLSLEGGGMQDRIAKATAETAKNTARMVYEFQATQSVYGN